MTLVRSLSPILVLVAACAGEPLPEHASGREAIDNPAVRVIGSGRWDDLHLCLPIDGCAWDNYFWVNLSVRNDAYDKTVAVMWTMDEWKTIQTSYAWYEETMDDGRERWGVEVWFGLYGSPAVGPPRPSEIEYAVYVVMGGELSWEPHNNHFIFRKVDPYYPVLLLDSRANLADDGSATVEGDIRVYNFAYDKELVVRYSTDEWATSAEVGAQWERDNHWRFQLAGIGADELPEMLEFEIIYRAAGGEYRSPPYGGYHRVALAPRVWLQFPWIDTSRPIGGVVRVIVNVETDLPLESVRSRIGDEPWFEHEEVGPPHWGRERLFTTQGMSDGLCAVAASATLVGGVERSAVVELTIENRIRAIEEWQLAPVREGDSSPRAYPWSPALDADGRLYAVWSDYGAYVDEPPYEGIARFDAYGTEAPPFFFDEPPPWEYGYTPMIDQLAVDDEGRVYGLQDYRFILRWTSSGALDTSFGDNGSLDLIQDYDGHEFGQVRAIAWGGGALWVVGFCSRYTSECEDSVNRFGEDGELLDYVTVPTDPDDHTLPDVLLYDGGAAYLPRRGDIVEVREDTGGELAVADVVDLDDSLELSPSGLARTPDGRFFLLDSQERLVLLEPDGDLAGFWYLRGRGPGEEPIGDAPSADAPLRLLDGTIGVLDRATSQIIRFEAIAD